ncbi:C-X-C motif chemokine 10-like [Diretmus argenteus]
MKLCLLLMCSTLVVLIDGMPPVSRDYNTRCHCLGVESRIIPPDSLKSIKIIPETSHCPTTEIIAGLVNGEKICLNPESSWVRKLIHFIFQRQKQNRPSTNLA